MSDNTAKSMRNGPRPSRNCERFNAISATGGTDFELFCYKKPVNVVFILTDDQGYWTLGCGGNPDVITPNLDKLAREGMRFDNFFCASPVCSPARATLLTGDIPSKHGIIDWLYGRDENEHLKGQTIYPEILADNGYKCSLSGKWHVGTVHRPPKAFENWFAIKYGSSVYYDAPMVKNGEEVQTKGYLTDLITDDAIGFIRQQVSDDKPFYASVHYNAPHRPWGDSHPREIYDMYEGCEFTSCPIEEPHPWLKRIGERDNTPREENIRWYYAAITAMDMAVGRLMDTLDELGVRDNTLVVFTSDNGFNCGHHGIWGKGNGTFPQNLYDTSVKVPAIFSHPGRIPGGVVRDDMVSQYDFFPTLMDYLSIEYAPGTARPGQSFAPLLIGEETQGFDRVVVYDEYGPVRMIRSKDYKYIHRYPYGPHEFYDLRHDPDEKQNLIGEAHIKETLHSLRADMESWFLKYADPKKDARQFAVTGDGQNDLIRLALEGKNPFDDGLIVDGPRLVQE